jgi:leucyl-tRNA synthetase
MDPRYDFAAVERDAQDFWDRTDAFQVTEDPTREKFYCLSMFPYPSGRLHMGHVRNYTIGDVISRYQRMLGKNVLQPMGWDAFGLPAENAAMQNNVPPAKWTHENIEYMKGQLRQLGFAYDWSRELATCDPSYYRWEQWLLTRLYAKGVLYRRMAEVNWDPVDQTVLANEQVIDGRGWRSGAPVQRRQIPHWFLKITDYAEELLSALDTLDWPDAVKTMQRNWIGRSEGVEMDFQIAASGSGQGEPLRIYTTRPDTLFGVTFMAVAAGHPLAEEAARDNPGLAAFIEQCHKGGTSAAELETAEKVGMDTGRRAINPMNGETVPIWVANYVLMGYGTGAIMAVPGHDERDHEFARKYGLPIRQVIGPADGSALDIQAASWTAKEDMVTVDSGEFSGLAFQDAFDRIAAHLEERGIGTRRVNYRLRDWGVSRQRYWGCPVPVLHTESGEIPVPDDLLPVLLPTNAEGDDPTAPLAKRPDFVSTTDPATGEPARRETDTLDTFAESSWYYARFACADNDQAMLDERANYWLPVDQYVGGIEHAILHLLYARFFHKLMRDEGLVDSDEPFSNLLTQGMVVAETFFREDGGRTIWYAPAEVEVERDDKGKVTGARLKSDGAAVTVGPIEKMSKSKNNGVDPQAMIERYGADTVRLYMMETSPPDQMLEWSDSAVEGASRFLRRLWRLVHEHLTHGAAPTPDTGALHGDAKQLRRQIHETIAKVSDDVGRRYKFNTAVAACRELVNAVAEPASKGIHRAVVQEALDAVVLMLAPVIPHACHTLWQALGHREAVIDAPWPVADERAMARDEVELVVQVNGKLRGRVTVASNAGPDEVKAAAMAIENVARFINGKTPRKVIVVPGRLVNVVV